MVIETFLEGRGRGVGPPLSTGPIARSEGEPTVGPMAKGSRNCLKAMGSSQGNAFTKNVKTIATAGALGPR